MAKIHELRPSADTDKITINLGYVDLGHVDLMVRTAFIRIARTSFERRFGTSWIATTKFSRTPSRDNNWILECAATVGRTSRP
jgi:hypothetical protein